MKKICYNCKFYGKCNMVKSCQDFIPYSSDDKDVVLNIEQFNRKWIKKYKRFYMFLDDNIIAERYRKVDKYLNGETTEEYIEKQENSLYKEVLDNVKQGNTIS